MKDWLARQMEELADWIGAFAWPTSRAVQLAVAGIFCVSVVVVGFVLTACFGDTMVPREVEDSPVYLEIKPGMTAADIGEALATREVIGNRTLFWVTAKVKGLESKFRAGTYRFRRGMDAGEVLEILVEGRTAPLRFTIPEGFTVAEIAERLDAAGIASAAEIRREAKVFAPFRYIKTVPATRYRAEGFLFPDTYEIEPGMRARDILLMMASNFDDQLDEARRARASELGLSVYELVTLASLVEKEARYEDDRAQIAQVFFKRMEIGMPLQSDAPIQYLLHAPKEDLTYKDTEIESPYNTYQHMGLPPGPIANPGIAAIDAVLYPAKTDYLYFVADRQGHNHYARSYDEHLALVAQYR